MPFPRGFWNVGATRTGSPAWSGNQSAIGAAGRGPKDPGTGFVGRFCRRSPAGGAALSKLSMLNAWPRGQENGEAAEADGSAAFSTQKRVTLPPPVYVLLAYAPDQHAQ